MDCIGMFGVLPSGGSWGSSRRVFSRVDTRPGNGLHRNVWGPSIRGFLGFQQEGLQQGGHKTGQWSSYNLVSGRGATCIPCCCCISTRKKCSPYWCPYYPVAAVALQQANTLTLLLLLLLPFAAVALEQETLTFICANSAREPAGCAACQCSHMMWFGQPAPCSSSSCAYVAVLCSGSARGHLLPLPRPGAAAAAAAASADAWL
jgi:hypothetical protein